MDHGGEKWFFQKYNKQQGSYLSVFFFPCHENQHAENLCVFFGRKASGSSYFLSFKLCPNQSKSVSIASAEGWHLPEFLLVENAPKLP